MLRGLEAYDCGLRSLAAIAELTNLRRVDLSRNALTAIDALEGNALLRVLVLEDNELTSVTPLRDCKQIDRLSLAGNTGLAEVNGLRVTAKENCAADRVALLRVCIKLEDQVGAAKACFVGCWMLLWCIVHRFSVLLFIVLLFVVYRYSALLFNVLCLLF